MNNVTLPVRNLKIFLVEFHKQFLHAQSLHRSYVLNALHGDLPKPVEIKTHPIISQVNKLLWSLKKYIQHFLYIFLKRYVISFCSYSSDNRFTPLLYSVLDDLFIIHQALLVHIMWLFVVRGNLLFCFMAVCYAIIRHSTVERKVINKICPIFTKNISTCSPIQTHDENFFYSSKINPREVTLIYVNGSNAVKVIRVRNSSQLKMNISTLASW